MPLNDKQTNNSFSFQYFEYYSVQLIWLLLSDITHLDHFQTLLNPANLSIAHFNQFPELLFPFNLKYYSFY